MPANEPAKRLEISVTPAQRRIIRKAAKRAGWTVSHWVRNALLADLGPMREAFEDAEFWAKEG